MSVDILSEPAAARIIKKIKRKRHFSTQHGTGWRIYYTALVPDSGSITGRPVKAVTQHISSVMTLEDELTGAAARGDAAAVEDLLRAGARVNGENCYGRTALQVMMMGSVPVARLLLQHGADPNVSDCSTGATPLHDAARAGFVDTARLLLQFQADPQARDKSDCLPITLARQNDHTDVVSLLENL